MTPPRAPNDPQDDQKMTPNDPQEDPKIKTRRSKQKPQHNTTQLKTRQDKTRQDRTGQDKTRQEKTRRQDKTKQRQDETRQKRRKIKTAQTLPNKHDAANKGEGGDAAQSPPYHPRPQVGQRQSGPPPPGDLSRRGLFSHRFSLPVFTPTYLPKGLVLDPFWRTKSTQDHPKTPLETTFFQKRRFARNNIKTNIKSIKMTPR